jgi:hypothetical protein
MTSTRKSAQTHGDDRPTKPSVDAEIIPVHFNENPHILTHYGFCVSLPLVSRHHEIIVCPFACSGRPSLTLLPSRATPELGPPRSVLFSVGQLNHHCGPPSRSVTDCWFLLPCSQAQPRLPFGLRPPCEIIFACSFRSDITSGWATWFEISWCWVVHPTRN